MEVTMFQNIVVCSRNDSPLKDTKSNIVKRGNKWSEKVKKGNRILGKRTGLEDQGILTVYTSKVKAFLLILINMVKY